MKRKLVMRLLCITIVSAMLVTNAPVLFAQEDGQHTVIYDGQYMTGQVWGDTVILEDGQEISVNDCQVIENTQPEPEPVAAEPEPVAEPVVMAPVPEVPAETPEGDKDTTGDVADKKDETSTDKKEETSTDKKDDTSTDKKEDGSTDKKDDTSTDKKEDGSTDKKDDTSTDKKEDGSTDKKDDTSTDKKEDGSTDKKDDTSTDKKDDGSTDKKDDTSTDKKDDGSTDKKDDTSTDKKEDGSTDKKDDTSTDKKEDESTDKKDDTSTDEKGDESTDKKDDEIIDESTDVTEEPSLVTEEIVEEEPTLSDDISEIVSSDQNNPQMNIITPSVSAGIGFYVDELQEKYNVTFSDDFANVISEIEKEYVKSAIDKINADNVKKAEEEQRKKQEEQAARDAEDPQKTQENQNSQETAATVTVETLNPENYVIKTSNWQDVLAVYLLSQQKAGVGTFTLDASAKDGLAKIFASMNTAKTEDANLVCQPQYIADYVEKNQSTLTESDKAFLEEYTSPDFMVLCAASTGVKGFIVESLGENVSLERAQVVAAAYSLVGKISYFWGGKSSTVGWDSRWGTPLQVTAAGSNDSGSISSYGLDCSGFVTWAFINGYENSAASALIGHGTSLQWGMSEEITEEEAMPGDLLFLKEPGSSGINHVGIVVGRNEDGSLIAVHCNASDNGVVVQSAYQAGFRYVRRPLAYDDGAGEEQNFADTRAQLQAIKDEIAESNKSVAGTTAAKMVTYSITTTTTTDTTVNTVNPAGTSDKSSDAAISQSDNDDPLAWKLSQKSSAN
ncbi:MAG: NlpC/P60 family protein [Hespellia sp.]|nr:NlpC/P60 family protein [Hespellia sp.]